jgi:glycosyltransferase involved in cell wall biosynthesis
VTSPMSYALVTPAKNEAANLTRLAQSVAAQTRQPTRWIVVDNDSSDDTGQVAKELGARHDWIETISVPGQAMAPGAPVVRSFTAGLAKLGAEWPDVVVKLDADVSFESDYFERLVDAFAAEPTLGISSGLCYELEEGRWTPKHVTGDHVRGATRAYRAECLRAVLPLPEAVGWDGVDELKASVLGWKTAVISDLPFYHHRSVGERDGASTSRWLAEGSCAHYMGYGFAYLLVRTFGRALRDRDPAAFAMLWGFFGAKLRREPVYPDRAVRAYLRRQQRIRHLPLRMLESLGRRTA